MSDTIIAKLESGRAQKALEAVEEIKDKNYSGNFKAYAKKLGPMILSSGLGQSLVFVWAKSGNEESSSATKRAYFYLLKCIVEYLKDSSFLPAKLKSKLDLTDEAYYESKENFAKFFKGIVNLSMSEYSLLEREVLSYVKWLSRFSEALIEKQATDEQ